MAYRHPVRWIENVYSLFVNIDVKTKIMLLYIVPVIKIEFLNNKLFNDSSNFY